jgi:short-subunit dehydrogenase
MLHHFCTIKQKERNLPGSLAPSGISFATGTNTPFPHHAKNYMDKEPALPNPTIDPRKVAEAIISAAQKSQTAIKVGAMSKINTFIAKAAPVLANGSSANKPEA